MNIDKIIDLWSKSKYKTIMINSLPCVNHNGEISHGTGIYKKDQIILCGGEYKVEDYLRIIYKGSIFILDYVKDDYIVFSQILKGDINE